MIKGKVENLEKIIGLKEKEAINNINKHFEKIREEKLKRENEKFERSKRSLKMYFKSIVNNKIKNYKKSVEIEKKYLRYDSILTSFDSSWEKFINELRKDPNPYIKKSISIAKNTIKEFEKVKVGKLFENGRFPSNVKIEKTERPDSLIFVGRNKFLDLSPSNIRDEIKRDVISRMG